MQLYTRTHTHIYSNEIKNANNKISNKSYASYKTKIAGITLIALVITIIILLILTGVTIGAVTNNGLLNKSKSAKENSDKSQAQEELRIKAMEIQTSKEGNATLQDYADYLKNDNNNYLYSNDLKIVSSDIPDLTRKTEFYIKNKGYWFKVDDKLNINYIDFQEAEQNIKSVQQIGSETEFKYTGNYQEYEVKDTGYYYIECLGAKGGKNNWAWTLLENAGTGGYASGIIKLNKGEKLFIYVGQKGENGTNTPGKLNATSFNGGGAGIGSPDGDDGGGAGGGATDIRLISGKYDDFNSLKSRIIVAGGGSGGATVAGDFKNKAGGSGGGIIANGSVWRYPSTENKNHMYNATQTSGYKFGIGENGQSYNNAGGAGAGGGYYGGKSSREIYPGGAGGGSGFISGYDGCDAIAENSTEDNIIHTGQSVHYSGKKFLNATLLDGNNSKIPYKNSDFGGNGYAKITYVGTNIVVKNLTKTEFKYTGNPQEYEAKNTGYYYIECLGAEGGANRNSSWGAAYWNNYGTGGYASGFIKLNRGEKLFVYVGQKGENGTNTPGKLTATSFNGGGAGIGSSDGDDGGGAGGGATDIRLISGKYDDFNSLKSRIIVAGGGSGSSVIDYSFSGKAGGSGGGISATGSIWKYQNIEIKNHTYNATQTLGYKFGIGENGITQGNAGGAGAGGGYYGGYSSKDNPSGGAGGGSGFISGYDGCDAIAENSTEDNIIHTGQSVHYSGKKFLNATLLDGNSNKIPYKNSDFNGNGYTSITFLDSNYENALSCMSIEKINRKLK